MAIDLKGQDFLLLDGAMGTVLQQRGLKPGGLPELLNFSDPELLKSIYRAYIDAGSQVIYANTFGANALKMKKSGKSVSEIIHTAIRLAKDAADGRAQVALDIGPLGELLEPMGTLTFEEACDLFAEMAEAGEAAGADLAVIETMTDLYEAKAALLAVKEHSGLPVFVTMSFDESGRTFTGCTVASMARTLEGLGADAIGLNCSLGPDRLSPLLKELCASTRLPVIAKPNAGLPDPVDGHYDMGPEDFAAALAPLRGAGVRIFGGCCGTDPEYIRILKAALQKEQAGSTPYKRESFVCTPVKPVSITGIRVIGERVNPTGKKRLQQALRENDLDYILDVAVAQEDAGADLLDLNVGYPGIDEAAMLPAVVKKIQSAVALPLQLDSSNAEALEAALRVYNGKAAVNSVNGKREVLDRILPIVKKYGAAVVGLTLDQNGIPQTADERFAIAKRILDAALSYGIPREDLWIDCLTLTVSAQQEQARETLEAVRRVHDELGLQVVLGVSNISFGLPNRALVTRTFLTQAMQVGLTLPIINPNQREMMDTVAAFRLLSGEDRECRAYIARETQLETAAPTAPAANMPKAPDLQDAICRGLAQEAAEIAKRKLDEMTELALVEKELIPALDRVGADYEAGRVFLPQLLSAAGAAQSVFEVIKNKMANSGSEMTIRGSLAVATVQGDVHDIGKNIVKTVLENYGYRVYDLGRDVPPERIVDFVQEHALRLVGLSALMTTTLPAMEETTRRLLSLPDPPTVFVGGAVVTPEYAAEIGARYARDARVSVEIAREVFGA